MHAVRVMLRHDSVMECSTLPVTINAMYTLTGILILLCSKHAWIYGGVWYQLTSYISNIHGLIAFLGHVPSIGNYLSFVQLGTKVPRKRNGSYLKNVTIIVYTCSPVSTFIKVGVFIASTISSYIYIC